MADTSPEDGDLWLPSEFPYEYGSVDSSSSIFSSSVESVVSSTESESDCDESLTGLTRRFSLSTLHSQQKSPHSPQNLQKPAVLFGSPELTFTAVGSWSVSSKGSPKAPFQFPPSPLEQNDSAWDLIYTAAGQVSRTGVVPPRVKVAAVGACTHCCFSSTLPKTNYNKQQSVSFGEFSHSPWPPLQIQHCYGHNQPQIYSGFVPKAVFLGGSDNNGVKKSVCTGTGVFLPRRYANPTESRKKPGYMTPPPRARVSQPQNKNTNITMAAHLQPQARPCFNDNLMGRRNAVLLIQQKASLPQDWTY